MLPELPPELAPMDQVQCEVRNGDVINVINRVAPAQCEVRSTDVLNAINRVAPASSSPGVAQEQDAPLEVLKGAALMAGEYMVEACQTMEDLKKKIQEQDSDNTHQEKKKQSLQHQLLDFAKYGRFEDVFRMLDSTNSALRQEVSQRPFGEIHGTDIISDVKRWSVAMQMIYMNASLEDFQRFLHEHASLFRLRLA